MDRVLAWHPHRIDLAGEREFRVGAAAIDPLSREATFAGKRERLQPQNLKVLVALARHRGEVVTREDLIDWCWDGRFVGEDVINRSISLLRQFAGRAGGFTIETVPKAGYRLVEAEPGRGLAQRPRVWLGAAAIGVLLAALLAWLILKDDVAQDPDPPTPTIAIAAFTTSSRDPLSRQVANATVASLANMLTESGFPIHRVQSSGAQKDADFVIGGDVQRRSGSLVATVTLIEARQGVGVYSNRFEEPEAKAMTIPDQVGASMATNLTWTAALMILDRREAFDPASLADQLTQLRIGVEGGDMLRALELARQAERRAPGQAMPQISLAFNSSFALPMLPRAERPDTVRQGRIAAERAIKLAPHFGDVYIPYTILHPWVWMSEREQRLRAALARDPDAPFVPAFLETLVTDGGRFDEGLEFARLAIADDQYKPAKLLRMIRDYELTGQPQRAAGIYEQSRRWWPHNRRIYIGRVLGLIGVANWDQLARDAVVANAEGLPIKPELSKALAEGVRGSDREGVRRHCAITDPNSIDAEMCLVALAQVGELDGAFAIANELYPRIKGKTRAEDEQLWLDTPEIWQLFLLSIKPTEPLRRDPRFLALAGKVGLLDYWRQTKLPDFCTRANEPVCARIRG